MKEEYKNFAAEFAETIVAQDLQSAHAFLAPWLQAKMTQNDLRAAIEDKLLEMNEIWEIDELIYPADFTIRHNSSSLEFLREKPSWREARNIAPEVTGENFRQWMVIQFLPDEADERVELDGWFDFWFILVEHEGEFRIGFFEIEDVD